jgi:sugar/nucleoside kinase (ribokinase family)
MSMSLLLTWTLLLILIASPTFIVPATARQSYHDTTHNNNNNNNKGNINILIAGSANMDTFLPINHLPSPGENLLLVPHHHPFDAPGGKGCNQAIASQLLSLSQNNQSTSRFIGRIGKDEAGRALCQILQSHNVDTAFLETVCASNQDHGQDQNGSIPTGRGYVFLEKESGKVSAVVSGGCNLYGWDGGGHGHGTNGHAKEQNLSNRMEEFFTPAENDATNNFYSCLLLQREVPEWVNLQFAKYAKSKGITVLQDVGGEDRIMHRDMMECCDFLMPNVTELERLVRSLRSTEQNENPYYQHTTTRTSPPLPLDPNKDHDRIIEYAKLLQQNGAKHVLVTLGSGGSLLVPSEGRGDVIFQPPCDRVLDPNGNEVPVHIVDETGAGDCYRAAFAVALMEHNVGSTDGTRTDDGGGGDEDSIPLDAECMRTCMEFASAAGALAVTKEGAVPSIPTRQEVDAVLQRNDLLASGAVPTRGIPRGGDQGQGNDNDDDAFPYMFGSRLNSMKDRPELWSKPVDNVREWVKRQGTIQGLGCVDFNYPQHFHSWSAAEAKVALDDVGLVAGAVCLRYPSKFARGAMNHPDEELRREAIELTKQAAGVARELGCDEVVIWSACKWWF